MMDPILFFALGGIAILVTTAAMMRSEVDKKTIDEKQVAHDTRILHIIELMWNGTTEWDKKPDIDISDAELKHSRMARSPRFINIYYINNTKIKKQFNKIIDYPMYSPNGIDFSQNIHLSCHLQKNLSDELWNKKGVVNMVFNVSTPQVSNTSTIYVKTATLKLYKQLNCGPKSNKEKIDDLPNCRPILSNKTTERRSNVQTTTAVPKYKQILVSIYAYTRQSRKKKLQKILLDSLMLPYLGDKWTEFNVRTAVKEWRKDTTTNLGLCIEVEDENGNLLPAKRFFQSMNCINDNQTTTPKPEDVSNVETELMTNFYTLQRYPEMFIENYESPATEVHNSMSQQFAKKAFEEYLARNASRSNNQSTENKP